MRLTLRTLLAYLDDILEPAQAREIGEKLNESSFAASLVSRIREVMRRRRLTAPTLSGPGVGIDPNTVAEYLDNTLPPDGVADVEKICLESDVHLAEAAACHQILTLALGEPVEVSSQTRERMYALGPAGARVAIPVPSTNGHGHGFSEQDADDVLAQAEVAAHPRPVVRAVVEPQRPEIPEYLRPHSNFKHALLFALAAVVLVVWGILVFNNNKFQGGAGGGKQPVDNAGPEIATNDGDKSPQDDATLPEQVEPDGKSVPDQVAMKESPDAKVASVDGVGRDRSAREAAAKKAVPSIDAPVEDEPDEDAAPVSKRPGLLAAKKPAQADAAEETKPGPTPNPPDESSNPPPAVAAAAPSIYVSPEGVTLHYVARDDRWFRLAPRSQVHAGDILAVPDPYQCALEVDGGKGLVTILGRSSVQMVAVPRPASFGLELRRGQFFIRPAGAADDPASGLRMGLVIAGEVWQAEIRPGTVLGVSVNPLEPSKFEQVPDKNAYFGSLTVSGGGSVAITDPAGVVHEIKGLATLDLPLLAGPDGKPAKPRRLEELPKWMGPPNLSSTEQNYARLFERKFVLGEAVELSIPEYASDPIPKISQMATEALGLIGAYGPLIDILHRSLHEEARKAAIFGLRMWLPRNPENKEILKAELAKRFPPDEADAIYTLLWGYDTDDARSKEISMQLIDWMAHPELAIRELAFYQVQRLTKKDLDYRAGYPLNKNKNSLKRWQEHVKKDGGLLPSQKPAPNPQ